MCERAETKTSRSMDFKNRKQNATAKFENIKTNTMYEKKDQRITNSIHWHGRSNTNDIVCFSVNSLHKAQNMFCSWFGLTLSKNHRLKIMR